MIYTKEERSNSVTEDPAGFEVVWQYHGVRISEQY